jgi:threonine dehydratase
MRAPRPTIEDVEQAAARIRPLACRTPLMRSEWLSSLTNADVWLKLEIVQGTGSFKLRGAVNAIARLKETRPDVRSVTTASAGNHGLALATAGAAMGVAVRVHLPLSAPEAKRGALKRLGAEIIEAPTYDQAEANAQEEIARTGAVFISAYSHSDVIAGAGTAALEMIEDQPSIDTFIVPLGGGGLLSGTAIVARARVPGAMIVGAEAEASPVFTGALAAGRPVTVPVAHTVADGLAGNMEPDSQTFEIVRDLVDRVVTVREEAIVEAMRDIPRRERLIAEGAAATAVAAVLHSGLRLTGRRIGILLTGRNVDGVVPPSHHASADDRSPGEDSFHNFQPIGDRSPSQS